MLKRAIHDDNDECKEEDEEEEKESSSDDLERQSFLDTDYNEEKSSHAPF